MRRLKNWNRRANDKKGVRTGSRFGIEIVLDHVAVAGHDEERVDGALGQFVAGVALCVDPGAGRREARADLQRQRHALVRMKPLSLLHSAIATFEHCIL